jgi:hypothetical protein
MSPILFSDLKMAPDLNKKQPCRHILNQFQLIDTAWDPCYSGETLPLRACMSQCGFRPVGRDEYKD